MDNELLRRIELAANRGESISADDALFMLAIIARLRRFDVDDKASRPTPPEPK